MPTTAKQPPATDTGETEAMFDPHPEDPWHPDWTPRADSADDLIRPGASQTVPTKAGETFTVDRARDQPEVGRAHVTIRPAGGFRERVAGARYPLGLLGLFVVYVTMSLSLSAVAPAVGLGWTSVVITSGSMAPSIGVGDVVVASPHNGQGLGQGTVVVFFDPARLGLVTHRIESVNPDGSYVTYGDANRDPDSTPLRPEQIVGVGRILVPFLGLPMTWYWAGAWGKLAFWTTGILLALWLARYAFLPKSGPPAQPEESGHVPG